MKKLLLLGLMLLGMAGAVSAQKVATKPLPLLKEGAINTADYNIEPVGTSTLTTDNLYAAKFTSTNGQPSNVFQYKNLDVSKYEKIVIKFGETITEGAAWRINLPDGSFTELPNDVNQYEVDLTGYDTYGDFTIFSWFQTGKSLTITEVYLYTTGYEWETQTQIVSEAGEALEFGSVVTDNTLVSFVSNGQMLYGTTQDNQIYSRDINEAFGIVDLAGAANSTYQFRISVANDEGLTLPTGVSTLYRIKAFKSDPYTGPGWNGANSFYFNDISWTYNVVAQGNEGEVACFFGITAVEGKTNTYKITSYKKDGTLMHENIYNKSEWTFCVVSKVEKEIEVLVPEKKLVAANDEIFAMNNFTNGKWTLTDPVSLYDWNYLVIATENTAANGSHKIVLTDKSGKAVGGDDYHGDAVGTGAGMWLDYWNSQNIIAIDLNQLRLVNGLDIFNIVSLEITGDIMPSVVYLTDYANPKLTSRGRWDLYVAGDVKREYSETGKYGTICLPYVASYAGCEVYSIAGKSSEGILLEQVSGLLEAGKPYFYVSSDQNGQNNEGNTRNVNFFRADWAEDVASPLPVEETNGLIGTFTDNTEVPYGKFILYNNQTYYVDSEFYVDANRAYIDRSKIVNKQDAGTRTLLLPCDGVDDNDPTAIESTEAVEVLNEGVFYDMSGREVKNPTTGIYIVKYGNVTKKVMIK